MRKLRLTLAALAAIAAAASCATMEEIEPSDVRMLAGGDHPSITFSASLGASTKTVYNEDKSVSWAEGDCLTVFDAAGHSETFTVEEECDNFSFTSNGTLADGPYYAVAGYGDATPTFDKDKAAISVALPAAVTDGTFASADLIASTTSGTSFTFHHALGILKMSITSDDISAIEFSAEGVTGEDGVKIGFGEDGAPDITCDKSGSSVTIEGITGPGTYYMAVNPGTYEDGFTIYLTCDGARKKLSSDKALTATAGKVINLGELDESKATTINEWQLVTALGDLCVGDQVIIAAANYLYAMSTTQGETNRSSTDITKSDDKSKLAQEPSSSVQILTIEKGSVSGTYAFNTGDGYLYSASSKSNCLGTQDDIDANASWAISVSDGVASLASQGSNTRNTMLFSLTTKIFTSYKSDSKMSPIALYRNITVSGEGPSLEEINSFLEETVWGAYDYNPSTNALTPLYQYDVRKGSEAAGTAQYAVSGSGENVSFRLQCLKEGLLASVSLPTTTPVADNTYTASIFACGVDGISDGVTGMDLTVAKLTDDAIWLCQEGGTAAFIIPTK